VIMLMGPGIPLRRRQEGLAPYIPFRLLWMPIFLLVRLRHHFCHENMDATQYANISKPLSNSNDSNGNLYARVLTISLGIIILPLVMVG